MLDGGGVVLGRVPDVLGRVVVGRVRRRMDRRDALQQPARLVEAGQRFRVVGSGVVRDDRDLAGLGFALESFQREGRLPGVPVLLGRVRRDFFAGRGEGVGEGLGRLLPVHGRSGALSFRGLHAAGPGLVLGAGLSLAVWAFRPWPNMTLTWVVAQAMRRVVAFSSRCSSNGSGRFEVRPAQAQEQPVRGVRPVLGVEHDLHDLTYRRGVPELGADTRLGGRPGEDFLEFLFLVAGGFRRVLIPRMAGQDRAHPGGLPVGQPFLHCPLGPLNHLRDDVDSDSFRGVQDRFCFHPNQHMIVGTLLPPDQDGGFFRGDLNLHAPIIFETAQEIHEKYGFVSCQP